MTDATEDMSQNDETWKNKLSHKKWKALQKKLKRRTKRQAAASERDQFKEPTPPPTRQEMLFVKQQKESDEWRRHKEHALWLAREQRAQQEFLLKKEKEKEEERKRKEEDDRIKREWEERQKMEQEEEEEKKKKEEEKKKKQDELLKEATSAKKKPESWHNPLAPVHYSTEEDANICPFFAKVGACRFAERCSRSHPLPGSSCTLLFSNMYNHFELDQGLIEEYDLDVGLEYEKGELYQHYQDFYEDIVPEFKHVGKVVQVKVCCNYEPHLRGNVYVQFAREEDAQKAFIQFNARWYAGKQISGQFTHVSKWKNAICGLFDRKRCPKGKNCNFLHCFRNPHNEFWDADFDRYTLSKSPNRRSPHKKYRRSRSRSRSRYSSRQSSSTKRHRSPKRRREYSPHRRRSRSRSRSFSRYDRHSRSPPRKSRSSRRTYSPRRSRSPPRKQYDSPGRRSRSPRKRSRSPRRSKSPKRQSKYSDSDSDSLELSIRKTSSQQNVKSSSTPCKDGSLSPDTELKIKSAADNGTFCGAKTPKHKKPKKHKKNKTKDYG